MKNLGIFENIGRLPGGGRAGRPLLAVAVVALMLSLVAFVGRQGSGTADSSGIAAGTPTPSLSALVASPATRTPAVTPAPTATKAGEDVPQEANPQPVEESGEAANVPVAHKVQAGETLSEIAERYGISPDTIIWANNGVDDPDFLNEGQELVIPPMSGIMHTVLDGDTLLDVAMMYGSEVESIAEANDLPDPFMIAIGQRLVVPGGVPPEPEEPEPEALLVAMAEPARADTADLSSRGEREEPAPAAAVSEVVPVPGLSEEHAAFIAQLIGPAQRSQLETGVPASVTIAQAIWEADWGRSGLARRANNYFGIKGRPNPGPAGVIWLDTWEHVNGRNVTVKEPFKVYNSLLESVLDHGVFIANSARYAKAMANADDPRLFIQLVHQAGYATDPAYTDKIVRLMDRYDLYVYDVY